MSNETSTEWRQNTLAIGTVQFLLIKTKIYIECLKYAFESLRVFILTKTSNSLSLETGWKKHKLQLFFKMQNNLAPDYLSSLVPPTVGSTSAYPLRNSSNLHTLHDAKTQLYFNSFLPSVIRDWNELPEEIRFSSSLGAFKYKLNRDVIMPPKFYFTGKRLGQIYHARLRTNCSSLNQQLSFHFTFN